MKFVGMVLNQNKLALILGIFIVLLGLIIAYIAQKKLFDPCRSKVANVSDLEDE